MSSQEYRTTSINSLNIERFRSIRSLALTDLPDLIVFHGQNGVGKSNIMRAPALLFHWASRPGPLPSEKEPLRLSIQEASYELGVRPDDFTRGQLPNMRLAAKIQLGDRSKRTILAETDFGVLSLEARLQDKGDGTFSLWFDKAVVEGSLSLFSTPKSAQSAKQSAQLKIQLSQTENALYNTSIQLRTAADPQRVALETQQAQQRLSRDNLQQQLTQINSSRSDEELVAERIRFSLLGKSLLHRSVANRHVFRETSDGVVPTHSIDKAIAFQTELFRAATSEDRGKRKSFREFSSHLSNLDLFGDNSDMSVAAVSNSTFDEHQLLISSQAQNTEDLPLENLGTGQQQAIMLLAQSTIANCPIVQIEEPEAHLHHELMERVARYLKRSLNRESGQLFDQLWIATHNHQFSIAEEYFDVRLEDGHTVVNKEKRPMAAKHFYEPGPLWDALRELVGNGVPRDTIIFRDKTGNPVTAGQILKSIEENGQLANEYVEVATQAVAMSLKRGNPEQ